MEFQDLMELRNRRNPRAIGQDPKSRVCEVQVTDQTGALLAKGIFPVWMLPGGGAA